MEVLRACFFSYTFPFFVWLSPLFPILQSAHREALKRKFRVGIRIIHRFLSTAATYLLALVKERRLEAYVTADLKKRLQKVHKSDLGKSLFINDIFY